MLVKRKRTAFRRPPAKLHGVMRGQTIGPCKGRMSTAPEWSCDFRWHTWGQRSQTASPAAPAAGSALPRCAAAATAASGHSSVCAAADRSAPAQMIGNLTKRIWFKWLTASSQQCTAPHMSSLPSEAWRIQFKDGISAACSCSHIGLQVSQGVWSYLKDVCRAESKEEVNGPAGCCRTAQRRGRLLRRWRVQTSSVAATCPGSPPARQLPED